MGANLANSGGMENTDIELSDLEHSVMKLQHELVSFHSPVDALLSNESIRAYAEQLARHYFPKKCHSELYIEPVIHSFCCDLVLAPAIHGTKHLWRYNYDDLDIVSNFYHFSQEQLKYYHFASGRNDTPTLEAFEEGLRLFRVRLGTAHIEKLFDTYSVEGLRARVAARVIEAIAGRAQDEILNRHYGFLENESIQCLRKMKGLGRFRFLRRGRDWMAIGTHAAHGTVDIRKQPLADVFGYRVRLTQEGIQVGLSRRLIDQAKADMSGILERGARVFARIRKASEYYKHFHEEHRFANAASWLILDDWLVVRASILLRSVPKKSVKERPSANAALSSKVAETNAVCRTYRGEPISSGTPRNNSAARS
ncbi:MAG TPA: hypothetical protein VEZ90_07000 [Blastocatellia bacterium]|nr:hypothetical protein [Blastocatellia bacterium]